MLDTAFYLVTQDILQRAGLVGQRYKTQDGRYILDNKDLSRVRFTTDEYVNGLSGVEKITASKAQELIANGGYQMDEVPVNTEESLVENEQQEDTVEQESESENETTSESNEQQQEGGVEQTNNNEEE